MYVQGVIQKPLEHDKVGTYVSGEKCLFLSTFEVKNIHVEVGQYSQKRSNYVHVSSFWMTPSTKYASLGSSDGNVIF